ncbi:M16 family metallopeptidase [Leptolyngbya sp. AN02str]|uniref:M16 family metallopeptidase n=1 Tax=Leptolyngbya sp. AN02str TaxID=3423363 RepID=UPI003D31BE64
MQFIHRLAQRRPRNVSPSRFRSVRIYPALLAVLTCGLMMALSLLHPAPVRAAEPLHYNQLEFPSLREVQLPDYTRFRLRNGMVVYLIEDHEFPLIGGTAIFRTGSRIEPAEKTGLASVVGEVMRSGGTTNHPADELNLLLEQMAAQVETGIDTSSGFASFNCLTEDLESVLGLFAEVVRSPAFPQERLDLSKNQRRGGIARRNDQPENIVGREFSKLLYGENSPYARTIEYRTLEAITREDVVAFHQQYFRPDNMLLGIVGDFDTAAMRSLLQRTFGEWRADPSAPQPERALPDVTQATQGGVFLIDQPQLTQSYIQIGHLGGQLKDPDYTALSVLNDVLNGFGGRLTNEVRSRQGLAYVVYAYWNPRFDYPGTFVGGGQTRSDATVAFIEAMKSELEKVRNTPISEAELQQAKDSVLNAFVFNFQTPGQLLSRLMRYEYYGYPKDFIFQYQRQVQATTPEDILQAAQTHLKPDQLVTVVVGNASAIQPPLSAIAPNGQVSTIDITIPDP